MAWTYNVAQLAASPLMQVRRLIGDVLTNDQQLQDEEINFAISQSPNLYRAAADCCEQLSAQYARMPDVVQGELKTNHSEKAKQYERQAQYLRRSAAVRGAGVPYAGGLDVQDKQQQVQNPDRVQPSFNIGMQDNFLPVSPAGNEVPGTNPPPDASGE